tara:strand:- start:2107 stop:2505 length:399 start_codon:yes stop_codon:yes gene_type:complete
LTEGDVMRIYVEKKANRIKFKVLPGNRSRVKRFYFQVHQVIEQLKKKEDLSEYDFLSSESSGDFSYGMENAIYVFQKKPVDIKKDYVKIDQTIEAEPPQVEEQKNEASLPYGLKKQAKTKKKKATKKKITEE